MAKYGASTKTTINGRVEYLRIHSIINEQLTMPGERLQRKQVISMINNNHEIWTVFKSNKHNGSWDYGEKIHVVENEYLRTDHNKTKADNIGSLPEE